MINRSRPVDALLAALATLTVALPLTSLFATAQWLGPAVLLVVVVALTGVVLRPRVLSPWLVGLAQLALVIMLSGLLFARDDLWYGLPGRSALRTAGLLVSDAYENIQVHSAPAPVTEGTVFALAGLIAVTAVAVDLIAVGLRSPTLAGLPLLAAYLTSATNAGTGLGAIYFVIPAAVWVTMVGRQGVGSVRRWATAVTRSDAEHPIASEPDDVALDFASLGRVLGVATIALAVLVTPLIPHLPTTFLAEGLGRASGSGGDSGLHLSSTLDVAKNLGDRSKDPVIVYTAPASAAQIPLRVDVLSTYENGQWAESPRRVVSPTGGVLPEPPAASLGASSSARMRVLENHLSAPQLALPDLTTRISAESVPLSVDFQGTVRVPRRVPSYTADFLILDPTDADFAGEGNGEVGQGNLALDPRSLAAVRSALAAAVPANATPLETARDIQSYLRSPAFIYSLTLAPAPPGADPITAFLQTKQGYCVQFATAMVMMARASGIPARMAIGFLPGAFADGQYTVVAADAHAWPELYFPQLGWVRFEPTPGTRSGTAPAYTITPVSATPSASPTSGTSAPTPTPTRSTPRKDTLAVDTAGGGSGNAVAQWFANHRTALLVLLAVLVLVLLLPVGAWVRRWRARRRAVDDAARAEAEWQSLLARLDDVGISPPPGATPRQTGRYVRERAYLSGDSQEALGRVVATIERGRYAAPTAELADLRPDARTVWRAASRTRSRSLRLRAALAPSEGVRAWSGWADAALALPRWASRSWRAVVRRRERAPQARDHGPRGHGPSQGPDPR